MLNFCVRVVCLLTASLMATHALAQDLSGWSDKTVCRLVESDSSIVYFEEANRRGIICNSVMPTIAEEIRVVQELLTRIKHYSGPIDGVWGSKIESALRLFLSSNNKVWDGTINSNLLAQLEHGVIGCSHENKKYRDKRIKDCVFGSSLELDQFLKNTDKIYVDQNLKITGPGVFDFQNKSISYSGFNKKCRKSRTGSDPFIFIGSSAGDEVIIKNLTIRRSSPDGVEVARGTNVKFVNLNIMHSCDEGISVRRKANIEIIDSLIVSRFNKGIMFQSHNKAKIVNSTISSEQAFSLQYENLTVDVLNSAIKKHPLAQDGRLITGENCRDISIYLTKTKVSGLQQLNGSKNCSNIVIVRK